jgi:dephospho-CoA kinase
MKVIGLTGGIGSGKSTVSRFLGELGAVIIDVDKVGHDDLKNPEIRQEIIAAFGERVLTPAGDIDRSRLGNIVFGDAEALERLNRIMHPRMHDMIKAQLEDYRKRGVAVVVLEAPLLVEAGGTSMVDEVWVMVSPETTVLKRLRERSGLSESETLARIHSQISSEERVKHADVIIDNDGSLGELKAKVEGLWRRLKPSA